MSRLKKPNMKLEFYLRIYIYTYLFRYKSWNVYCSYTEFIHQTTALQVDLRYMCLQLLYVVGVHSCWSLAPVCVCESKWEFATSVAHHLTSYVHDGSPVLKQQTCCYLHWCCISMTRLQKRFWPVLLQVLGLFFASLLLTFEPFDGIPPCSKNQQARWQQLVPLRSRRHAEAPMRMHCLEGIPWPRGQRPVVVIIQQDTWIRLGIISIWWAWDRTHLFVHLKYSKHSWLAASIIWVASSPNESFLGLHVTWAAGPSLYNWNALTWSDHIHFVWWSHWKETDRSSPTILNYHHQSSVKMNHPSTYQRCLLV